MIVDAVDKQGRRYMATGGAGFGLGEECVECGHLTGPDYYMRNDAADGTQADRLEAALSALTYDAVCVACAEAQLKADAT